jgi:hypothetical protein
MRNLTVLLCDKFQKCWPCRHTFIANSPLVATGDWRLATGDWRLATGVPTLKLDYIASMDMMISDYELERI